MLEPTNTTGPILHQLSRGYTNVKIFKWDHRIRPKEDILMFFRSLSVDPLKEKKH